MYPVSMINSTIGFGISRPKHVTPVSSLSKPTPDEINLKKAPPLDPEETAAVTTAKTKNLLGKLASFGQVALCLGVVALAVLFTTGKRKS